MSSLSSRMYTTSCPYFILFEYPGGKLVTTLHLNYHVTNCTLQADDSIIPFCNTYTTIPPPCHNSVSLSCGLVCSMLDVLSRIVLDLVSVRVVSWIHMRMALPFPKWKCTELTYLVHALRAPHACSAL